jgi:pimeloyl-ACP methyl ester carboxylesterase
MVAGGGEPSLLYALAEASYLHGEHARAREHVLAAAVYAYAFLFPEQPDAALPGPFDPRVRDAADLYNWALTAAFASEDGSLVVPRADHLALPFGPIDIAFDPAELRAGSRELYNLVPAAELEVRGLAMRYRQPGIGAPLAASTRPLEDGSNTDMVAPRLRVPVTALLRIADARRSIVEGRPLRATLELHLAWDDDSVTIGGATVPLENEPTAALALTFTGLPIMQLELVGFLGRLTGILAERPPLVSTTPYRPGHIPIVFVHGTASSAIRWAELYNRLQADPELRSRYQFWFFQYDSDNPIALSALRLREALGAAVERLDPDGRDEALRQMVLVGHSQGGLLVRMQSIDTGDRLWNAVSRKPLEELRLTDKNRALLKRGMFVEPVPGVSRVIFIATPHRTPRRPRSFRPRWTICRRIIRSFSAYRRSRSRSRSARTRSSRWTVRVL